MSGTSIPLATQGVNPLTAYQQAQQLALTQAQAQNEQATVPLTQAQAQQAGALADLTQAQATGADISNQNAALALAARRMFYGAALPPSATPSGNGNPLAAVGASMTGNGGSGSSAAPSQGAPPSAGASAPGTPANLGAMAPPSDGSASPAPAGGQGQGGSTYGGVMTPAGFSVPAMQYYGAMTAPDPNAAFKNLFGMRSQVLAQTASQATDNASWNAGLAKELASGWITPDDASRLYNRFDLQKGVITSLADPNTQVNQQTSLYNRNMAPTAEGPQPLAAGIATAAATAGATATATAQGAGQFTLQQITAPSGQLDAHGQPILASYTVRTSDVPAFMAAHQGARATSAADMANPNIAISPDTFSARVNAHESPGNYGAANSSGAGGTATTSAAGGMQFTLGTWVGLVKSAAPNVAASMSDAQIAALRSDTSPAGVAFQNQMAVAYAKQNAPTLAAAGQPVNSLTLGIAHEFGPSGAVAVMQAPQTARITPQLVGQAAYNANPAWQGKTVGAIMADAYKNYGVNPVDFSGANSPAAGGASAPPAPGIPGNVVQTPQQAQTMALDKSQGESNIGAWGTYRTQMMSDSDAAASSNALFDQMKQESQSWQPGRFADVKGNLMSMVDSVGQSFGFKPMQSVGDWQAFNKNAMQVAQTAVKSISSTSGIQELSAVRGALPSDTMSPQGFRQVASELQGLNDWRIAKANAAANGDASTNPDQFSSHWNQTVSPVPFIVARMSTADAQLMAANMNRTTAGKAEWQSILKQMTDLDSRGLLSQGGAN